MRVPHYFLLTAYPGTMRTMLAAAPFRWTDLTTWPWMFYVWAAFAIAGLAKPAWSWLQRRRAAGWPVADGRIESVKVSNRRLSFPANRSYCFAELGYSYSVAETFILVATGATFQLNRKQRSLCAISKATRSWFTTIPANPPILHCSNPILRLCCKTVLLPRLLTFPRPQNRYQTGSDRSSGSLFGSLPDASRCFSSADGFRIALTYGTHNRVAAERWV
jgi:hypothetical protein